MMKLYAAKLCAFSVVLMFNSFLLLAQVPSYYNGTDISKTGSSLKTELAALITGTHTTNLSYTPGVWEAIKQTDLDPDNPENVLLVYGYDNQDGNIQTDRTRSKDRNGGNTGDWNREHVFAKSLGNPNLGESGPGSDAHHLRAADVGFNALRGNLPFENASGNARRVNNSWYPGDEWKGDIARMVMYMYLRYGDRCLPSAIGVGSQNYSSDMMDVFLEWNAQDPVSQYELNRNNILENLQGNRNPFIDNPAFATSIWGGPQAEDRFGGTTVPSSTILINEIDSDTPGVDTMEFIELYDGGTGNTSLDGLVVVLYNGANDQSYRTFDLSGYTTDAGGYFVLGNAEVPNVSLVFPNNTLQNGPDAVALYLGSASDFPNGSPVITENLVDAIVYDTNDPVAPGLLPLLNEGQLQVNEGGGGDKDNHSLQRIPNGSGGARNTDTYAPAIPTPGTPNAGTVPDELITIQEARNAAEGSEVTITGMLTVSDQLGGPSYIQDATGGIAVFDNSVHGSGTFRIGDSITVTGTRSSFNELAQLTSVTAVRYHGPANTPVIPKEIVLAEMGEHPGELVRITDVTFPEPGETLSGNTNYILTDASGEGELRISNNVEEIVGLIQPEDCPEVTGVVGRFREVHQLLPRMHADMACAEKEVPLPVTIAEAREAAEGATVTISGVLTVSDQLGGPAYIQDATGGIAVFDASVHGSGIFQIGDSVTLTGTRSVFNDMKQISPASAVTYHGPATQPVVPKETTLSGMGDYPGQLVRITDVSFPQPGDMLFGNSNYMLTDSSGSGELRINNNVSDIVGLAQPETCAELVGVVGRFREIYQLLPRMNDDLPCTEKYIPEGDDLNIPKDETLDVVTWNIEWFGDVSNAPPAGHPDAELIQKDSVKSILARMDADVIAVEEISNDALFAQMVAEMDGYGYVLSDYTSYPHDTGVKQKVGFIYRTSTVSPVEMKPLLATIHPYYNGGDESFLADYPENPDRFFASGRLPFLMTADVTIGETTEQIHFVALHARANSSSGAQSRYDMRKYDVEVLKDSLDVMYGDAGLIVLGDFNDDVDETVADGINTTVTSYVAYMNDPANYNVVSSTLSDRGFRSYVFRENMIDHIMISNELEDYFIEGSARVGYEFYSSSYTNTTSDHFPVYARFRLQTTALVAGVETVDVNCFGEEDGMAAVSVSGGLPPYAYMWSNGEETATVSGLGSGRYTVTVTDAMGRQVTAEVEIGEPEGMEITIDGNEKVYPGYRGRETATLSAWVSGGTPGYTYLWSTGDTTAGITVSPVETTVYTLTVTDDKGCSSTEEIMVEAEDISCGHDGFFNRIKLCYKGKTLCMSEVAATQLLRLGATLGSCDGASGEPRISGARIAPNPVRNHTHITLESDAQTSVLVTIHDERGNLVYADEKPVQQGKNKIKMDFSAYRRGMYICKLQVVGGKEVITRKILKF